MKSKSGLAASIARFATTLTTVSLLAVSGCALSGPEKVVLTDAEISNEITAALGADSRFDAYNINVTTEDAGVRLTGAVATGSERDAAERIAKASRGVDHVENDIRFGKTALRDAASTP
jgi:osmotically-inducible protein OsmY